MTTKPRIILNNITFHLPQTSVKFNNINLAFEELKYGIVGDNGVGKTTFLKLVLGDLVPDSGIIQRPCNVINVPQSHTAIDDQATISDALHVTPMLAALDRINNGSTNERDFDIMADFWDISNRIEIALAAFNLWPIDLTKLFHQLSGGQKTKVLLAKSLIFNSDFVLFDEPTNNLDTNSRIILYDYIENSPKGMLLVSHDRTLLNKCDQIVEITTKGIDIYGGNYDFYSEQKAIKLKALEQELQAQKEILKKAKQTIQTRMERHQQNEAKGRKGKIAQIKAKGSYDKIAFKTQQGRSEKTNRRIRTQATRKLETINTALSTAHAKLEVHEKVDVCLAGTEVPNNKTVVKIENLNFSYDMQHPLIKDFNLHLTGPNRTAIIGSNGCGKSTLIKLIRGYLVPNSGEITIGVDNVAYLDQSINFLDDNLSIIDNFLKLNPDSKPFDAYSALARFNFRNIDAEKCVKDLSGGGRIRAGLAICLMSIHPPQLIILDEPTNHLDITTIQAIEKALKLYQGAIIAVSHDREFLNNIDIQHMIDLK